MKKVSILLLSFLFVGVQLLQAQGTEVSGTVTSSEDGQPIPGVAVVATGTTAGTTTDIDGEYSLTVPEGVSTLSFSFVGMQNQVVEIGGRTQIDVVMEPDFVGLDEVVVTALGITRNAKALGYSVEKVDDDQIARSGRTSVVDALGARVAGVRINRASGEAGASTFIEIRGAASLTRSNQPLFVVDGVPIDNSGNTGNTIDGVTESNRAIDINPNDVAEISVLKGGAATALYGIRAANGAIIITTKSGQKGTGVKVNYNGSVSINQVSQLPPLQQKYAQGSEIYMGLYDRTAVQMPDEGIYNAVSWGPAIESLRYTTDPDYVPGDHYVFGGTTPMDEWITNWDPNGRLVPADSEYAGSKMAEAYDHYDFFQTGLSFNNHIDISGGDDKSTFFMSVSNTTDEGVIPNNTFDKTTFKVAATRDISNKLNVGATVNYVNSEGNRIQKGSNVSGIMLGLLRSSPTFDNSFKYQLPDGSQRTYQGGGGYDNPNWITNKILYNDIVDRVFGNVNLNYRPTDWLSFTYRLGVDAWYKDVKDYFEIGSSQFPTGQVDDWNSVNKDMNSDLIMTIQRQLTSDWGFTLTAGHNMFQTKYSYTEAIAYGLTDLGFYNMNNSSDVRGYEGSSKKRTAAIFGDLAINYRELFFLNATGRQEWSTTMPADANSFFYPSVSTGFVFSELPILQDGILSFGKLRASYAQIANDAALFATDNYFFRAAPIDGWTNGLTYPFLGINAFTLGGTIGNTELTPETMNSLEFGIDLRFIDNRLGLDVGYFKNENNDLLLPQEIAPSTGFAAAYVNAGSMETSGFEVLFTAVPVQTSEFRWTIQATWSNPYSEVTKLAENVPNLFLSGFVEPQVRAVEGQPYRTLFGLKWARDENGNVLINDNPNDAYMDGFPFSDPEMQAMGSVMPDWTAGITNAFTYKGLTLSALLDIKQGGLMWNGTKGALYYFGTHADTESRGETKVWEGVRGHVDIDGNVMHYEGENVVAGSGDANTEEVVVDEDWYWWSGEGSGFTGPSEPYIEEADWVRLRELTFSYAVPKSILGDGFLQNLEVYFTGINLWLDTPYTGVDPETSLVGNNNGLGIDYFNNPGTKSYIFGLRLGF
ncbi:MAG: SusC/RagA family TonB-linked outer membrane protein [Bacteroidota bacterium]